jgi:hypothetical protein
MTVSSNLRSTKTLAEFIRLSDEAQTAAARLKAIEREIQAMTPEVLEQIGEARTVKHAGQIRTLKRNVTAKISRTCDDETAVEFCKSHGLKFQTRTPHYVAPATFSSYVKSGLMSEELYSIENAVSVVIV